MTEQLVSLKTKSILHDKGFFNGGFNIDIRPTSNLPTQSLVQKWLREVHNIEVLVYCNASGWMWELNKAMNLNSFSGGTHIKWSEESGTNDSGEWDIYEEALEQGIIEALKLIK